MSALFDLALGCSTSNYALSVVSGWIVRSLNTLLVHRSAGYSLMQAISIADRVFVP